MSKRTKGQEVAEMSNPLTCFKCGAPVIEGSDLCRGCLDEELKPYQIAQTPTEDKLTKIRKDIADKKSKAVRVVEILPDGKVEDVPPIQPVDPKVNEITPECKTVGQPPIIEESAPTVKDEKKSNENPSILKAAREYLIQGYSVIPIKKGEKRPSISWDEYQDRLPTESELCKWFENTDNQIGIVTGNVSGGLFILDFDGDEWEKAFYEFLGRFEEFADSLIVKTGSGKGHIYGICHEMPRELTRRVKKYTVDGKTTAVIELRANDSQTLCPPSLHPCGEHYTLIDETKEPVPINLSRLSDILALVNEAEPTEAKDDGKQPEGWHEYIFQGVCEGERNTSLVKETGRLLGKGLSRSEILPVLLQANSSFNPPLDETEVETILDSMIKKDERKAKRRELKSLKSKDDGTPAPEPKLTGDDEELVFNDFSDTENARRFLKFNPDNFLWIEDLQRWWHFDPTRPGWGNGEMAVRSHMKDVADEIRKKVLLMSFADEKQRIEKLKQCISWKDANGIENSIKMLRDASFSQSVKFDTDPFLFLCANGVINLRIEELSNNVFELRELDTLKPSDRLHKFSPVKYDPNAKCPQWRKFLLETFLDNHDLLLFIQKFSGYTLTGDTREEKFLMLEGPGSNGKSTLLEVLAGVLGEYGVPVPFATFKDPKWDQGGNTHQADMVQMIGARFIRSVEVKERARLNIERLKSLTGNDMMSARPAYSRDYIKFYPVGKIWLAVNHLPKIYDTTASCWRRLLRIPFSYIVPPEKRILDLSKKLLKEESSGILNWMLEGCLIWQDEGIEPIPSCVKDATDDYQMDSNPIKRFISEKCEIGDKFQITMKAFYEELQKWWKDEMGDINPMSKIEVGKELKRRGFEPQLFHKTKYYVGLRLLAVE
jgi:putative DNA primase/helicase